VPSVKNSAVETAGRKSVKVKKKTIPSLEGKGLRTVKKEVTTTLSLTPIKGEGTIG